ncbi:MAG TPA: AAA family ATPase [Verrucomicrobiota bacterium]|jgi:hypothetical protein|nr:AAA family ATPase [Verrucomicrobiota bacterium]HQL80053.1 AAA family ATPase [Verrucomicrobiota bacterium]
MSRTRRAEPGKPLRQERWCSSEAYERGLLANVVARRCRVLKRPEDRELVYFLQKLSQEEGGLHKAAEDLAAMFPERFGTKSMQRFGMKPGQVYSAQQVKLIRREIGRGGPELPLYGDPREALEELLDAASGRPLLAPWQDKRPTAYRLEDILDRSEAVRKLLPSFLEELCLNPAIMLEDCAPWYFPDLIQSLRDFEAARVRESRAVTAVTTIGSLVYESLDYALEGKCLVLIEGLARTGKTFAAKAWCAERPGKARYVQAPSTNDDIGFFRAIAKSLGVSINLNSKAQELRQRIEETLQPGGLAVVFDEAHWLWPSGTYRDALPGRINWIMTALVNYGVPVGLVTTPQFLRSQKKVEQKSCWTSEQFIGRIGHYQKLPDSLGEADLAKVASALLPEGDSKSFELLVTYAQASAKYLAGIESAVRRARYLARKEGRERVVCADIRRAIKDGVIPSDSALAQALAEPLKTSRRHAAMPLKARLIEPVEQPGRAVALAAARPGVEGIEPAEFTGRNRLSSPRIAAELVSA